MKIKTKAMIKLLMFISIGVLIFNAYACNSGPISYSSGDLQVEIETGEHWTHEIPLFLFIKLQAPPQMAIWVEDTDGNYIETLYVTEKTAQQKWLKAPGDDTSKEDIRRPESLPFWTHKQNAHSPDTVSGATPKGDFTCGIDSKLLPETFVVFVEVNASLDFNEHFPSDAEPEDPNYSGGPWGSGQPALIYKAEIDSSASTEEWQLELVGHSSADGTSGDLYENLEPLTTARSIVGKISVKITKL